MANKMTNEISMKKRDLMIFFNSGAERIFKNVTKVEMGTPKEWNGLDDTPIFIEYDREENGGIKRGCHDCIRMCDIASFTEIDGITPFSVEDIIGYQKWYDFYFNA